MSDTQADDFVFVPAAVAKHSVGFSLDGGGSTFKLVFRSRQDYKNGECLNQDVPEDKGILRLATFQSPEAETVVNYITEHCDAIKDAGNKVHCTGVTVNGLHKELREKLGLEIHCEPEFDMLLKSFRYFFTEFPRRSLVHPANARDIKEADDWLEPWLVFNDVQEKHSNLCVSSNVDDNQSAFGTEMGDKFKDVETEEDDFETCDVRQSLVTQMGSALVLYKMNSDWTADIVSVIHTGGRGFLGVGNAICGETKTFEDLLSLADSGKTENVDVHVGELKCADMKSFYDDLPDNSFAYACGQMAFSDPKKFSTEDKIAGWLDMVCAHYAEFLHMGALLHGVDRVFAVGGFCNHPVVRRGITKFWKMRNVMYGMGKNVKIHFLKNGQHLAAIGTFMKGAEQAEMKE